MCNIDNKKLKECLELSYMFLRCYIASRPQSTALASTALFPKIGVNLDSDDDLEGEVDGFEYDELNANQISPRCHLSSFLSNETDFMSDSKFRSKIPALLDACNSLARQVVSRCTRPFI